jgi:hypothetical protein
LQLLADYEGNIFYSRGFPVVNEWILSNK